MRKSGHEANKHLPPVLTSTAFLVILCFSIRDNFIAAKFMLSMTKGTFTYSTCASFWMQMSKYLHVFKLNYNIVVAENHAQDEEEFDPMEAHLCKQIKQEKVTYKNTIDRLKALRTEIEHLQLLLERVKVKIQKDFQKWWSQEASNLQ
ncbi:hypothetical protein GOODEAATRI_017866, partial [Goodea atripinnis]